VILLDELLVRDVMSPAAVCLHREATVAEAVQALVGAAVQSAPVLDAVGELIGVVSTTDLIAAVAPSFRPGEPLDVHALHDLKLQHVHELLERSAVTCDDDLAIADACQLMVRERVHRLVVTRDNRPVGLVSAIDLVRAVACLAARHQD
jgi:predicted transcriptional regulator